jgi:alanyl-tRNA synthetase
MHGKTTASEVRTKFFDYFKSKQHKIVDSAPIVVKDDPTLMFTNAGMNQFKDYFLGNKQASEQRVADTQKCLRVSGKHNDLEEVGVDTYHHTMFEMLGNWSFGDYFKEEAIEWAWDLLTNVYELPKDRLYVTVFEGDKSDSLDADNEAAKIWEKYISKDRILYCDKKDNFWEMGETGPCGPCSEIHMDLRPQEEIDKLPGVDLVNKDHDQVIELWNLVFIQYNRKADTSLVNLPDKHVDTGMGLERVLRAVNLQSSNYDSDLFMDTIQELEKISGKKYGKNEETDIAFRVISDHLRAVSFCISDGQLPENGGAGYVVRRILRRAVRYGYSFLDLEKPFLFGLVELLADKFKDVFPDLHAQKDFVAKVVEQEEKSFLNTLNNGLKLFDNFKSDLSGVDAFELYDTFGFPIDLTQLLAKEKGFKVDLEGFKAELQKQKDRSRADAKKSAGDWVIIAEDEREEFVGYDYTETEVKITRYREVEAKGKKQYHLVFNLTPFYAESGGQVGDKGVIIGKDNDEKVGIIDTQKENQLILQIADKLPENVNQHFVAKVNAQKREDTTYNHSATHLLHAALKQVLGDHVHQKGSLVNEKHLRFDFSHFQKVSKEELSEIERIANEKIRQAIPLNEARNVPYDEAISTGATALFGEKYGDVVRVITFDKDFSVELCGGTHVQNTANIGQIRITHETSVAAGVRRIEAVTGVGAEKLISSKLQLLENIGQTLGNQQDVVKAIESLLKENTDLKTKVQEFEQAQQGDLKGDLLAKFKEINGVNTLVEIVNVSNAGQAKDLCFQFKEELENVFCVLLADINGKPSISIMISDAVVSDKGWNAGQLIREWAKEVKGGGGGQPFFAQAGGADPSGLPKVKELAEAFVNL